MNNAIFMPMMLLAGWTLLVMMVIPYRRFKAGFAKQVSTQDFLLGESDRVPGWVKIPNRNFMNLLESPLLFYVVCLIAYLTGQITSLVVTLAWGFLLARILHSLVHLTYNRVGHRLICFAIANLILLALWVRVFWGLV
ncbi:MAPEG family protein [Neptuniibacter sp. CAU 1671]|uniref:MAPEG family protein n=1 Tax=Neptuniibacter sp. CAU 1671 TaxID=3032593 RepID=UPI0023DC7313|nr:MAPEG family protein [Neptuniibacter sp. CAU 1671]MDF2183106.1 MAPEG family protein [Neptuniibacter sp. CAU 1671]